MTKKTTIAEGIQRLLRDCVYKVAFEKKSKSVTKQHLLRHLLTQKDLPFDACVHGVGLSAHNPKKIGDLSSLPHRRIDEKVHTVETQPVGILARHLSQPRCPHIAANNHHQTVRYDGVSMGQCWARS